MTTAERNAMQMGRDALRLLIKRYTALLEFSHRMYQGESEAHVETERIVLAKMTKALEGRDEPR